MNHDSDDRDIADRIRTQRIRKRHSGTRDE